MTAPDAASGLLDRALGVADFAARSALGLAAFFVFWSVVPVAFGWESHVIMSGSMEPRLHAGDVVVVQPVNSARVTIGEVVLVDNPARPGTTLVHRVVEKNVGGAFITRGDANSAADSTPVPPVMLRGLPRLCVPYVALPLVWLATGDYYSLGLTVFAVGATLLALRHRG